MDAINSGSETDPPPNHAELQTEASGAQGATRPRNATTGSKRRSDSIIIDSEDDSDFFPSTDHIVNDNFQFATGGAAASATATAAPPNPPPREPAAAAATTPSKAAEAPAGAGKGRATSKSPAPAAPAAAAAEEDAGADADNEGDEGPAPAARKKAPRGKRRATPPPPPPAAAAGYDGEEGGSDEEFVPAPPARKRNARARRKAAAKPVAYDDGSDWEGGDADLDADEPLTSTPRAKATGKRKAPAKAKSPGKVRKRAAAAPKKAAPGKRKPKDAADKLYAVNTSEASVLSTNKGLDADVIDEEIAAAAARQAPPGTPAPAVADIEMVTPPAPRAPPKKGKKTAQKALTPLQRVAAFVNGGGADADAGTAAEEGSALPVIAAKGKGAKRTPKGKAAPAKATKTITKSAKGKGRGASAKKALATEAIDEGEDAPSPTSTKQTAKGKGVKKNGGKGNAAKSTVPQAAPKITAKAALSKAKGSATKPRSTTSKVTPSKGAALKSTPKKASKGKGALLKSSSEKVTPAKSGTSTPKKAKGEVAKESAPIEKAVKGTPKAKGNGSTPNGKTVGESTSEKEKKSTRRADLGMISCSSRDSVTTSLLEHAVTQLGGYSMVDGSDGLAIKAYIIGADTRRGWGILYAIARGIPLVSDTWLSASISAGNWLPVGKYLNTRFIATTQPKAPILAGMRIKVAAEGSDAPMMRRVVTAAGARVAQTRCDLVINDGEAVDTALNNVSKKWLADSIEQGKKLEVNSYLVTA